MSLSINPMKFVQNFITEVSSHEARVNADRVLAFPDTSFQIEGSADPSKRFRFEADGITADTERILTVPDYAQTLGGVGHRRVPLVGASSLTLTDAMSGSVVECGAGEDFLLPAVTAANLGVYFEFIVTVTATNFTITAATGDLLHGGVSIMSTNAGLENDAFSADGTDDLIFSMNGTTQGGIIGSTVRFYAASATKWLVAGNLIGSGSLATPFS
jgi:hypothetical protein